ncbi:MAG: DUF3596 domain-containing protein [Pegethrix bostrychoides GSE-TBD4-15B]|jgi:hypothetical protein|uniref:DUF3596 domain-containing protein n=1 Tax=Pegethrix bostrychoides GSE-TBD4-15B TaxID=2839662 RepID=A0A951PAA2_9CYAN|nr:DUF3596 domain-containing protein [Pegethrix bostrychoides GSE-TBD4-15B]
MSAQRKASKGSVGIEVFQGRLRLRLPRQLYEGKQKYLTLGIADTAQNHKLAEAKARQIELDILAGYFDASLEKYRPQSYSTPDKPTKGKELTLSVLWSQYTEYKAKTLSVTTINKDFRKTRNHIESLPTQRLADAVSIRDASARTVTP